MTASTSPASALESLPDTRPWWQHLSAYHWFVLLVASMAWFFDCLDQRIFTLARNDAVAAVMNMAGNSTAVQAAGKNVTAIFLIGWGLGGLFFGALGDKHGRAKMLTISILIYSICTGLSFFSKTPLDFALSRFLTGVGVGGVFGLAVALVAETVPSSARPQALGLLQLLSAVGNITSSFVLKGVTALTVAGKLPQGQGWRYMFLVGAFPALLVIFTGWFLKEPEPWLKLQAEGRLPKGNIFAPYAKLFGELRWRKNLVVGALIASTGVVGLWAIGEYAPDLQTNLFTSYYNSHPDEVPGLKAQAYTSAVGDEAKAKARKAAISASVGEAKSNAFLVNQIGAVIGMWIFTRIAMALGRRPAFLLGFAAALVITVLVYWQMKTPTDAYWMMPLMGIAQLSVFAGFSIYLPELFPSSLRSTGTSFCYNLGRFAAAGGSFFSAQISGLFKTSDLTSPNPLRYSAMIMCAIFLVGIVTLPFAPETKGQPLPVD